MDVENEDFAAVQACEPELAAVIGESAVMRLVASTDPTEVADRLADVLTATGCDTLNLRVFHAGISPALAREQIERLGGEVLPRLRKVLPAVAGGSTRGEP